MYVIYLYNLIFQRVFSYVGISTIKYTNMYSQIHKCKYIDILSIRNIQGMIHRRIKRTHLIYTHGNGIIGRVRIFACKSNGKQY